MLSKSFAGPANDHVIDLRLPTDGIEIVKRCLPDELIVQLTHSFPSACRNRRNGLQYADIRELAGHRLIRNLATPVLGENCLAVRVILFNKTSQSNWKVAWHQDCVIAVKSRTNVDGWGPWSLKLGVPHVRPPAGVLENMLAVRVHLDDCGADNGPLRVLPGTHLLGVLPDSELAMLPKADEIVCSVDRGDAILMRPLIVHASSAAYKLIARRVVHIEFAAEGLPFPMQWNDQVTANGSDPQECQPKL